jgi:NAD(P)H-hydrate epimerase
MRGDLWPLVGAEAMRRLDRHTIEGLGVPGDLLMESAGRLVAEVARGELAPGGTVWAVCGSGQNGGDGLVAARHLHLKGVPVAVLFVGDPARLRGDAAANRERARAAGVPFAARLRPEPGSVLIDAIFGTGLDRPVEGPTAAAIRRIQGCRPACQVVAVDLPSGVDADTGQPLGVAVEADVTVTLGLPKLGLALEPGRRLAGRIVVGRIGIADQAPGVEAEAWLLTRAAAGARLPLRPADGHKGSFGHALVVAGSEGKTGAAALAAEGAARAGAGLVTLACAAGLHDVLETKCTEAMTAPLPPPGARALGLEAEKPLLDLAATRDAVAAGPGLGRCDETAELVRRVAARIEAPLVLDADGALAFADDPGRLARRRGPTVLTPHPGEAASLLGSTPAEVNRDRVGAARALAEATRSVVVLKGAATVIAQPGGQVRVNPTGGPALATGGTGDVLTGVVAGLLAQGLEAFEAASLAAYLHGLASDRLAARFGPAGSLAGDVARELPAALAELREAAGRRGSLPLGVEDAAAFPEPR